MKSLQTATYIAILFMFGVLLMVWGKSFLVPFLIAFYIWYLIITLTDTLQNLRLPYPLALLGAFAVLSFMLYILVSAISSNIASVVALAPVYQQKFNALSDKIFLSLKISIPTLQDMVAEFNFTSFARSLASMVTEIAGSAGLIGIYVLFLLLEHHLFDAKLHALIPSKEALAKTQKIVRDVGNRVQSYVMIKTAMSALTAFLSYLVLHFVGVDFAQFWALLIFLLNYIPTIGSIVATIFPCLLTLLQFSELAPFFIVTTLLIAIQFLMGNIVEPKLMGKSFNLSPLVILLSLAVFGQIWGIMGMFLCVPLLVIAVIICSNFQATRPIAILLSEKGQI